MAITAARLEVDVDADTRGAERGLGRVNKSIDSFAGKVGATAKRVAKFGLLAAGAGGVAAVAFGGKAISAASDLNETVSQTGEVFGDARKIVLDGADQMADRFGIVKQEFIAGANNLGLLAKGAGFADDAAAQLGTEFAKLAADASSFYNVPIPQALDDIRSGLSGESEPLKKYGILINEAAIKTRAFEMGLEDADGNLSVYAKTQARAALITEGFATAQGDLERTSGSLANKTRSLKGMFSNFTAELGERLLPIAQSVAGWLGERLPAALDALKAWIDETALPALARLKDNIAVWWEETGRPAWESFVSAMKDNWPEIREIFANLGDALSALGDAFGTIFRGMASDAEETDRSISGSVGAVVDVLRILSGAVRLMVQAWGVQLRIQRAVTETVGRVIVNVFNAIHEVINRSIERLNQFIDLANRIPGIDVPKVPTLPTAPPAPSKTGGAVSERPVVVYLDGRQVGSSRSLNDGLRAFERQQENLTGGVAFG